MGRWRPAEESKGTSDITFWKMILVAVLAVSHGGVGIYVKDQLGPFERKRSRMTPRFGAWNNQQK